MIVMGEAKRCHLGKIKILIADDHTLVREGSRQILEKEADLEVVAEAGACDVAIFTV